MRDGFSRGWRGHGSPGDPDLDATLPIAPLFDALLSPDAAEALLDGRAPRVPPPPELRPLEDMVAALRAPAYGAFPRGEERVLAAFRALSGRPGAGPRAAGANGAGPGDGSLDDTRIDGPWPDAPWLDGQWGQGRPGRPPRRRERPPGRPPARRRLALATASAAAFVLVMGIIAYTGVLPGPFQRAAHVAIGAPSVQRTTPPAHPAPRATGGGGGLAGSSATAPVAPTQAPRAHASAGPTPSATATPRTAAQMCQAYLADPLHDASDFRKLAAIAGGPLKVWAYCLPFFRDGKGKPFPFPFGGPGGIPGPSAPVPGAGPGPGGGNGQAGGPGPGDDAAPGAARGGSSPGLAAPARGMSPAPGGNPGSPGSGDGSGDGGASGNGPGQAGQ
ncbi:MAG TPA: hypothetical protein VH478_15910 [Trebonia sp.]|jgi:hypothetical protein|nr:hypothetical protein [Trebonia sp.]